MKQKNHDYAGKSDDEPYRNFTQTEVLRITSTERGMLVRLSDKISRLITFIDDGTLLVADESVEDTLIDMINYPILLAGYLREKKQ